jgi:hypothetical protein
MWIHTCAWVQLSGQRLPLTLGISKWFPASVYLYLTVPRAPKFYFYFRLYCLVCSWFLHQFSLLSLPTSAGGKLVIHFFLECVFFSYYLFSKPGLGDFLLFIGKFQIRLYVYVRGFGGAIVKTSSLHQSTFYRKLGTPVSFHRECWRGTVAWD